MRLKPCPFCGGKARVMKMGYPHWIYCEKCGAKIHAGTTDEKDSIRAWNKRAKTEPVMVPIAEIKFDENKLKELVNKAVLTVFPQETESEWEHDHEILKAYSDGASEVLDKIRAEIETKYGQCKLTEYIVQYDGICTSANDIGDIADILQIIDKYKAESEEVNGR